MAYVDYLFVLGRVLYGGFFLLGGLNHFTNLNMMAGYAGSKGVPAAKAGVVVSGLLIVAGGALVIVGAHITIAAGCIVLFLVPVTYLMHDFWSEKEMMGRINQQVNFQKNLALLGAALMMLMIPRPWPFSLHF
jgi:uncharacterized membrane protein YphA (DoxX/SURF4 family)